MPAHRSHPHRAPPPRRGRRGAAPRARTPARLTRRRRRPPPGWAGRAAVAGPEAPAAPERAAPGDRRVRAARRAADRLATPAGLTAVTGPGLAVSLDDVPRDQQHRD